MSGKLDELKLHIAESVGEHQRTLVLNAFNAIIAASPVDTGRYRSNHIVSVGTADHRIDVGHGISVGVIDYKSLPTIYIQNNLPYARRLEDGWSRQAPAGVYAIGLQAAQRSGR